MRWRHGIGTGILLAVLGLAAGALSLTGAAPAEAARELPLAAREPGKPAAGRTAEERLWLLGGLGLALGATGVVAGAAVRSHREPPGNTEPGSNPYV
ncbi:hypothetical protein ACFY7C_35170 [Streptomyces sp. NPDC012769]|uniref:hypothetical protein n=1 Tax=Streptomyces sp. NPDC012769 TaxID=3364848 RepID=UPI0036C5DB5F